MSDLMTLYNTRIDIRMANFMVLHAVITLQAIAIIVMALVTGRVHKHQEPANISKRRK